MAVWVSGTGREGIFPGGGYIGRVQSGGGRNSGRGINKLVIFYLNLNLKLARADGIESDGQIQVMHRQ